MAIKNEMKKKIDSIFQLSSNSIRISIMTTIEIISRAEYKASGIANSVGTLMFGDDWYDCKHYVDLYELRKNITLPKGSQIHNILVKTQSHPQFKNIANKQIPYKYALCSDKTADGAFYKSFGRWEGGMYAVMNPLGDAVIVVSKK